MSANNEYKRYFIILQEDDKGYEMAAGKIPTGYVKIEVKHGKVKLTAFIQNVKSEQNMEYHLILVAPGKKTAVDVGKVIVDSGGRGELYYEFESDNVLKSSLGISDFNVAAVTSGPSIPLSGYTGRDKMDWKGRYEIVNRPKVEPERIDKMKETVEEIVPMKTPAPPPAVEIPEMEQKPAVIEQPVVVEKPKPAPAPKKEEKPVVEVKPKKEEKPVVEVKPAPIIMPIIEVKPVKVEKKVEETVVVVMPEPKPEPKPEPIFIAMPKPEPVCPKPEPICPKPEPICQEPADKAFCPPIAPMEEPCEIEHKKGSGAPYQYYYYEEEESESDSDSDSDKHEHKNKCEEKEEEYYEGLYCHGSMQKGLMKILRRLRRYEPFDEDMRDCEWFKIGDNIHLMNTVSIPFMGYMVPMGYPFMMEECVFMMGRKDYIIGVKYYRDHKDDDRKRVRHIMFGIPAVYSKRNEMYYKSKGFVNYKTHKSDNYGYFIMCLDSETGMPARMS